MKIIFKCDVCGQFVSVSDLEAGYASHRMVTPDSDYSFEEFETLCKKHHTASKHKIQDLPPAQPTEIEKLTKRDQLPPPEGRGFLGMIG